MSVFSHETNSSRTPTSHKTCPYLFHIQGKKGTYFQDPITSDFTPVKALDYNRKNRRLVSYSIIPTFNADGRFYSQAFLVPYQGLEADSTMLTRHQTRLREVSAEVTSTEILLPKPRKSHYCYVCRMEFNDYLQHTKDENHTIAINNSKFHEHILNLTKKFKRIHKTAHQHTDYYTLRKRTPREKK